MVKSAVLYRWIQTSPTEPDAKRYLGAPLSVISVFACPCLHLCQPVVDILGLMFVCGRCRTLLSYPLKGRLWCHNRLKVGRRQGYLNLCLWRYMGHRVRIMQRKLPQRDVKCMEIMGSHWHIALDTFRCCLKDRMRQCLPKESSIFFPELRTCLMQITLPD